MPYAVASPKSGASTQRAAAKQTPRIKQKNASLPSYGDAERPRQSEVRELELSLAVDEQVLGLQVSVQPAPRKQHRTYTRYNAGKYGVILS